MYGLVVYAEAQEQVAALPGEALEGYAEVLGVSELAPWSGESQRHSRTFLLDQLAARHETIDELYDARLLHVLRRGIADRKSPGMLYDGFAIDYGCYVGLLIDGNLARPRDRGGWLKSPTGVPPDEFSPAREAVHLATLEQPAR